MTTYAGASMRRFEDPRLVQGKGSYVDDMLPTGVLFAAFLRSPHAHARILSVDTSPARQLPGVVATLTAADLEGSVGDIPANQVDPQPGLAAPEHPILARGKACYVGQPVAVVVAETREGARDAIEAIRVDYEVLPAIVDPLQALDPASEPIHAEIGTNLAVRHVMQRGDADAAIANAPHVVKGTYYVPRLAPAPMEGRGLVVDYDSGENSLTMWTSTQVPHKVRTFLAGLLGRPELNIRVIAPDVGGGFGQKVETWPEEVALCLAAIELQRPIKWVEERWENTLAYQARGYHGEITAGVDANGTILAMSMRMVGDLGGYFLTSTSRVARTTGQRVAGPYSIHDMTVEVLGVVTNKPPTGPYRGAGGPESAFMMERTIDMIAKELGMDPSEVRRRNFVSPSEFPYTTATGLTYDSGDFHPAFQRALELGEYDRYRRQQRNRRPGDPFIGVGLATVVKAAGGVGEMRDSSAIITVEPTGEVTVHTEVSPHGQGTETVFAQIVADQLGITPDRVRVLHGDSSVFPTGQGTFASRGLTIGGSAVYLGVEQAREKLASIAAQLLECDSADVTFQDGKASNASNPQQNVAFTELCRAAYETEDGPGMTFHQSFTLPGNAFGFGAHVVVVQVDPDTGEISFLKYAAVHDCGRIINPKLLEGQIHGALAQGLGQALMEAIQYGDDGQPLTATFADYCMPTAEDMPTLTAHTMETPSPINPLGVKGGGELPTVAAPVAVANALVDALSSAGVEHLDAPLTPERVWQALQESCR